MHGPKCYIGTNKSVILLVHLASFYDFCEFPMHKSNSDHPKIDDKMHIEVCLECDTSVHPPEAFEDVLQPLKVVRNQIFYTHANLKKSC